MGAGSDVAAISLGLSTSGNVWTELLHFGLTTGKKKTQVRMSPDTEGYGVEQLMLASRNIRWKGNTLTIGSRIRQWKLITDNRTVTFK